MPICSISWLNVPRSRSDTTVGSQRSRSVWARTFKSMVSAPPVSRAVMICATLVGIEVQVSRHPAYRQVFWARYLTRAMRPIGVCLVALVVAAPPGAAQTPPSPAQAQQVLDRAQQDPTLAAAIRARIQQSGLT